MAWYVGYRLQVVLFVVFLHGWLFNRFVCMVVAWFGVQLCCMCDCCRVGRLLVLYLRFLHRWLFSRASIMLLHNCSFSPALCMIVAWLVAQSCIIYVVA